jgi:hypothetical protein
MRIISKLILTYLILISILTLFGLLKFGHGMADFMYYISVWLATIMQISHYRKIKDGNRKDWLFQIIIFALFALFITYKVTIGRGGEYPWNGELLIF